MQDVDPANKATLPIGQSVQLIAPIKLEYFPGEHNLQDVDVLLALYEPTGQAMQEVGVGVK